MPEEQGSDLTRKRKVEDAELEIDINAPEPPSKKALRKAKKLKASNPTETTSTVEDADLKRLNGLDSERSKFGIWIGNLAFTTTKKDLYKFLLTNPDHALPPEQITRIHLPTSTNGKAQNKGFAYVDLDNQSLVDTAVQLSESLLGGRRLLIKDAKNYQGRPEVSKPKDEMTKRPPNRKIFVGNLDFDTTVEKLEKHFGVCGPILRTHLATFEDSGKCKGYGWVEFESLFSAETAMRGWTEVKRPRKGRVGDTTDEMKKIWLHRMGDRKLRMEFAEDSTTRYNKRFGKNITSQNPEEADDGMPSEEPKGDAAQSGETQHSSRTAAKRRPRESKDSSSTPLNSRYNKQTVRQLTGAIVEGQGSKVIFD